MSDARAYIEAQGLEEALAAAVKIVLEERPTNAIQRVGQLLSDLPITSASVMKEKKGFWVGNFTPKEGADMADFAANYRAPMVASFGPFGGKMVMGVMKPDAATYHGNAGAFNWVAEFPSLKQAQAWYESDAYKALLACRDKHITANYIIGEGTGA